jgi:hypothetical protein
MPLDRSASMSLTGAVPRVVFAVIRTLLDELDRLHREGDWAAADAVRRQLAEELKILSVVSPAIVV